MGLMDIKKPGVIFVGAGPGDPELLTVKGRKAIEKADFIIYAGSLVSRAVTELAREGVPLHDSSCMSLAESHELIRKAVGRGELIAHVHTGDPSLYGSLPEQIDLLERDGIAWELVPGITAACAAAAAAGVYFTQPRISQTLIITRQAGRTPMREEEALATLARHHTAMAIYLSGKLAATVQEELSKSLPGNTEIICAHKLGGPQQKIVRTRLEQLSACVESEGIEAQTVFLVLPGNAEVNRRSCHYLPEITQERRK